jgi:hypothetical protein
VSNTSFQGTPIGAPEFGVTPKHRSPQHDGNHMNISRSDLSRRVRCQGHFPCPRNWPARVDAVRYEPHHFNEGVG